VKLLEVDAARDVLLGASLEELVEGREGKVLPIDCLTEIEGHIVHQERFQLLLKPQDRLVCLHIDVKSAENGVFLGIDVWDQLQGLHLD
jgi:hypothetical protein